MNRKKGKRGKLMLPSTTKKDIWQLYKEGVLAADLPKYIISFWQISSQQPFFV
jgi:hypothetical protein